MTFLAVASSRACAIIVVSLVGVASAAPAYASDKPCADKTAEPSKARGYRNAVLHHDFPDPHVIRTDGGTFFAYSTQTERNGKVVHVQVARSRDLVRWTYLRDALPTLPDWGDNADVSWAPHVVHARGKYFMYYSTVPDELEDDFGLCLAVATSTRPAGPFRATAQPLHCGSTLADIDADVFRDRTAKTWRVYWGSGGDIVTARLAPSLTRLADPDAEPKTLLRGWSAQVSRTIERGIEGPFVIARRGWYYLFYSGNRCCSFPPHYATMVARSHHAAGPYHRLAEYRAGKSSAILHSNNGWAGPGHNSVIRDDAGRDWIVFHAINREFPFLPGSDDAVRRPMLINRLLYRHGWPLVPTGSPALGRNPAPLIR